MNTQEILNILKITGATFFGILAMHGYMTTDQASAIMGDLTIAVPALLSAGSMAWSIYAHWNMKKVPQNSVAIPKADVTSIAVKDGKDTIVSATAAKVVGALLVAFVLSAFLAIPSAQAQPKLKLPFDPMGLNNAAAKVQSAVTGQPAPDPTAALTCDFKMLTKLTPDNLVPTVKACLSDVNSKLVLDTQRALASAKAYGGSTTGTTTTSGAGDGDAVNCLTPALAIFQAGVQVPAIPAVVAADGTVTTPAVPAQDPGPILLYQKYREFTLSGALTACQAWFNGPINATAAAGVAGLGTAVGAAALLAPK